MSNKIESEVHRLMLNLGNAEVVAKELMENWSHKINSSSEALTLAEFFYAYGLYPQVVELSLKLLSDKKKILPWPYLYEVLNTSRETLSERILQAVIDGAKETGASVLLARSETVVQSSSEWSQIKKTSFQQQIIEAQLKKQELLDQVIVLRSQELFDQEKKQILKLLKMFPDDTEIKNLFSDFEKRQAQDIFSRRPEYVDLYKKYARTQSLEHDEVQILQIIEQACLQELKTTPELACDFAVMFYHFEDYARALEIVKQAPASSLKDWLEMELLFLSERYIELLSRLPEVEKKYHKQNEIQLACVYLRAQALWSLGEPALAIEAMENIVRTFPNYRSSMTLLQTWRGGSA